MRYLVLSDISAPFYTGWFDPENHFNPEAGMVVFDLLNHLYTIDGKTWKEIGQDHL